MPGVNLSQSITQKSAYQPKSGGEKGRLVIFGLFILTFLVWGGVRAGIFAYDKKITAIEQEIATKKAQFSGSAVSEVADVDARLALINQKKEGQVYPRTILVGLEGIVLPSNRVLSFEYDFAQNLVSLSVEAPGYKEVAQQLMAFKASPLFVNTTVSDLSREKNDEGNPAVVTFEIATSWNGKNQ
jgi:hypothetical protein